MRYVQKKILSLYVLTCRRPQRPTPRTCWNSRLVPWGKKCRDCKEDEFLERFLLVWDGFVWERFVLSERDWCCLREIGVVWERLVLCERDSCCLREILAVWERFLLSEKDSCLRNLNWSDLMAEAPPKSILYGRRYLNLSTATDMCLQYVSNQSLTLGR